MLRNIIFDMGNVLVKFDPAYFIERECASYSTEEKELLMKVTYGSKLWPLMDSGDINEEEFEKNASLSLPEKLRPAVHRLVSFWWDPIIPMPGMKDVVKDCKTAGFYVYLLSNASTMQKKYWPLIPGSEYFDGTVVSADIRIVKPNVRIYRHLLEKFSLKADECIFFDDLQANIQGAMQAGIKARLFTGDVIAVRQAIGLPTDISKKSD